MPQPAAGRPMRCACDSLVELHGDEAERYSREHVEKLDVDPLNWLVRYRCPDTGRLWIRDFPRGDPQAGGPPRLRQLHEDGNPMVEAGRD